MRGGYDGNCQECGAWTLCRAGLCKSCYEERDSDD